MDKFSRDLCTVTHRRWLINLNALAFLAVGLFLFANHLFVVGGVFALIASLLIRPNADWPSQAPRNAAVPRITKRKVPVVADEEGLSLDGKRVLARSEIAAAYYHAPAKTVRFRTFRSVFRRYFELEVKDESEARDLLSTLHLAASQSAATYDDPIFSRLARALFSGTVLFSIVIGGMLGVAGWWWYAVGALSADVAAILLAKSIRVGADGVFMGSPLRRRFISWRDVKAVFEEKTRAVLVLNSGKRVNVAHTDAAAIAARVREELAAFRDRAPEADAEVLLSRRGRSTRDWLRGLRAVADGSGYRAGALPVEQLWRIVEDSRAEAVVRAGAAIALGASLDEQSRARLRETAMTSAAPRVRVALEAVSRAEGDEELAAALEAFDDDATNASAAAQKSGST